MTVLPAVTSNQSEDTLLDGKVRLRQPLAGYRVAIDPVLLAASVPAQAGDRVLDIGCGVGAASLCLAHRVAGCRVTGIDTDRALVRLAGDNILLNGLTDQIQVMTGDLLRPPSRVEAGVYAHVMANPPHLESARAAPSPDPAKAAATREGAADLAAWLRFALVMVRPKGTITFIHRADRLEQLLAALAGPAGIVVYPLWPGGEKPAKRVLVRARKDVASPTRLMPGLVLHSADGKFTPAADAVLRIGAPLPID